MAALVLQGGQRNGREAGRVSAKSQNREKVQGTQGRDAKQDMGAPKTFTESMLGLRKGLQHPPGVPTLRTLQGRPGGEVTWKRKEGSAAPLS